MKVIAPGFFTTIQDLGRNGYQQYGMSQAGAMDSFSLQLANILVGNRRGEASLEITFVGPEIKFEEAATIAFAGADMSLEINETTISLNTAIAVKKDDVLRCGPLKSGCRLYMAIRGGLSVDKVMGSKSTFIKAGIGGLQGRAIRAGDSLAIGNTHFGEPIFEKIKVPCFEPREVYEIGMVAGPEVNLFSQKGIQTFLTSEYTVSSESDRMGYRLEGAQIDIKNKQDLISSGVALGTVQVPPGGKPIVLMADRQTTGGYPRIANVISADIPLLAQLKAGDKIRFVELTQEDAHKKLQQQQQVLNNIVCTKK